MSRYDLSSLQTSTNATRLRTTTVNRLATTKWAHTFAHVGWALNSIQTTSPVAVSAHALSARQLVMSVTSVTLASCLVKRSSQLMSTRAKFWTWSKLGVVGPPTWLELDRVGLNLIKLKLSPNPSQVFHGLSTKSQLLQSCFVIFRWLRGRSRTIEWFYSELVWVGSNRLTTRMQPLILKLGWSWLELGVAFDQGFSQRCHVWRVQSFLLLQI